MNSEFERNVIADLSELKTHMKTLVGNGQPGVVPQLEQRVRRLEGWQKYMAGGAAVIGFIVHGAIEWFHRH